MNFFSALLVLCLAAVASGFMVRPPATFSRGPLTAATQATSQFGQVAHKSRTMSRPVGSGLQMAAKTTAEPTKSFWEGEWVCADCGYIYDVDDCGGLYLEEQKRGFVCPQCRGPRRRFAKKVGDQVGITQDGGDAPILLFSFLGLAATVAFGFWFNGQ